MCYCCAQLFLSIKMHNDLIAQLLLNSSSYLDNLALHKLSQLSKKHHSWYQPSLRSQQLLASVLLGKRDEVGRLLETHPERLIQKIYIRDALGREFLNQISVFQYLLWSLDTGDMMDVILQHLLKNQNGFAVLQEMQKLYHQFSKAPLNYQYQGTIYTQNHYDFNIIEAFSAYAQHFSMILPNYTIEDLNFFDAHQMVYRWDEAQRQAAWLNIGLTQRQIPAGILRYYFSKNDRDPWPYPSLNFGSFAPITPVLPLLPNKGLGHDYAAYHGKNNDGAWAFYATTDSTKVGRYPYHYIIKASDALYDKDMLGRIKKARMADFYALQDLLSSLLTWHTTLFNPIVELPKWKKCIDWIIDNCALRPVLLGSLLNDASTDLLARSQIYELNAKNSLLSSMTFALLFNSSLSEDKRQSLIAGMLACPHRDWFLKEISEYFSMAIKHKKLNNSKQFNPNDMRLKSMWSWIQNIVFKNIPVLDRAAIYIASLENSHGDTNKWLLTLIDTCLSEIPELDLQISIINKLFQRLGDINTTGKVPTKDLVNIFIYSKYNDHSDATMPKITMRAKIDTMLFSTILSNLINAGKYQETVDTVNTFHTMIRVKYKIKYSSKPERESVLADILSQAITVFVKKFTGLACKEIDLNKLPIFQSYYGQFEENPWACDLIMDLISQGLISNLEWLPSPDKSFFFYKLLVSDKDNHTMIKNLYGQSTCNGLRTALEQHIKENLQTNNEVRVLDLLLFYQSLVEEKGDYLTFIKDLSSMDAFNRLYPIFFKNLDCLNKCIANYKTTHLTNKKYYFPIIKQAVDEDKLRFLSEVTFATMSQIETFNIEGFLDQLIQISLPIPPNLKMKWLGMIFTNGSWSQKIFVLENYENKAVIASATLTNKANHRYDWLTKEEMISFYSKYIFTNLFKQRSPNDQAKILAYISSNAGKKYQIYSKLDLIDQDLYHLEREVIKLDSEEQAALVNACGKFKITLNLYKENIAKLEDSDANLLQQQLNTLFKTPEIKRILQKHSSLYALIYEIIINIAALVTLSLGFVAYRAAQGFKYGFFIHQTTKREQLMQQLETNVRDIPELDQNAGFLTI